MVRTLATIEDTTHTPACDLSCRILAIEEIGGRPCAFLAARRKMLSIIWMAYGDGFQGTLSMLLQDHQGTSRSAPPSLGRAKMIELVSLAESLLDFSMCLVHTYCELRSREQYGVSGSRH